MLLVDYSLLIIRALLNLFLYAIYHTPLNTGASSGETLPVHRMKPPV